MAAELRRRAIHTNYRAVFGSRGQIAGPWRYDVYGSYYYVNFTQANDQYLSLTRIQNALLVGGTLQFYDPVGNASVTLGILTAQEVSEVLNG